MRPADAGSILQATTQLWTVHSGAAGRDLSTDGNPSRKGCARKLGGRAAGARAGRRPRPHARAARPCFSGSCARSRPGRAAASAPGTCAAHVRAKITLCWVHARGALVTGLPSEAVKFLCAVMYDSSSDGAEAGAQRAQAEAVCRDERRCCKEADLLFCVCGIVQPAPTQQSLRSGKTPFVHALHLLPRPDTRISECVLCTHTHCTCKPIQGTGYDEDCG